MTPRNTEELVTVKSLEGWLARMAVGWLAGAAVLAGAILIWAGKLEAKVDAVSVRVEEVRREGSVPMQDLRSDIKLLTQRIDELSRQLEKADARR